ncbi:FMN-binding negative transcriptional regulator [Mucilaginibacter sp.]
MYIPKFNAFPDKNEVISFMRKYSFGTVITSVDNLPVATHLPFLIEEKDNQVMISSHFAKANPQALDVDGIANLVIFTEPHAYISPKNYPKEAEVPTWNYIAVHAYGKARLLETEDENLSLLKHTINTYEPEYFKQWKKLPQEFKSKMIKGIVGFEIVVTDLQAKSKLSQNRSGVEKENIIHSLSKSPFESEREIAKYMASLKKH